MINAVNLNSQPDKLFTPPDSIGSTGEKFIVFSIGETFYGIAAREVTEVIRPIAAAALPNVPRWIFGIINLRGEIVPVIDLQILWEENCVAAGKSKFIVIRPEADFSETAIAFAVDRLGEIVSLSAGEIEPSDNINAPYIIGKAVYKAAALLIIDAKNLFASLAVN